MKKPLWRSSIVKKSDEQKPEEAKAEIKPSTTVPTKVEIRPLPKIEISMKTNVQPQQETQPVVTNIAPDIMSPKKETETPTVVKTEAKPEQAGPRRISFRPQGRPTTSAQTETPQPPKEEPPQLPNELRPPLPEEGPPPLPDTLPPPLPDTDVPSMPDFALDEIPEVDDDDSMLEELLRKEDEAKSFVKK